ncbi:hypothetical protein GCM10017784_07020 [Deinococcus indicus]|nr:hypothetical protein GCM10017784_07020 [Deinococcus indicus]
MNAGRKAVEFNVELRARQIKAERPFRTAELVVENEVPVIGEATLFIDAEQAEIRVVHAGQVDLNRQSALRGECRHGKTLPSLKLLGSWYGHGPIVSVHH